MDYIDPTTTLSFFIFFGSLLFTLIIREAVAVWFKSFKPDPIDLTYRNSIEILRLVTEQAEQRTQTLIELKQISISQENIARVLERMSDR